MKIISYLEDAAEIIENSVVALGNFDGIHKGHQQLINKAVELAEEKNCSSVVFTFANHPMNVLAKKTIVKSILSIEDKAKVLEDMNVDYMVNVPFNDFMRTSDPETFVKRAIVKSLKANHVVCGFNYTFGHMAKGTPEMLAEFGKQYGFDVTIIPEFDIGGFADSSTRIRKLIAEGDMKGYFDCVGRLYKINGRVIEGQRFGRTIGFPTINLNLLEEFALPLNGVYVTNTYIDGVKYRSVTNVGVKPTVGEFQKNAETHIFDFNQDVYGKLVSIEFLALLRPERKFENIEELGLQIKQDCLDARAYSC